jgi:hypothetical protein
MSDPWKTEQDTDIHSLSPVLSVTPAHLFQTMKFTLGFVIFAVSAFAAPTNDLAKRAAAGDVASLGYATTGGG